MTVRIDHWHEMTRFAIDVQQISVQLLHDALAADQVSRPYRKDLHYTQAGRVAHQTNVSSNSSARTQAYRYRDNLSLLQG